MIPVIGIIPLLVNDSGYRDNSPLVNDSGHLSLLPRDVQQIIYRMVFQMRMKDVCKEYRSLIFADFLCEGGCILIGNCFNCKAFQKRIFRYDECRPRKYFFSSGMNHMCGFKRAPDENMRFIFK